MTFARYLLNMPKSGHSLLTFVIALMMALSVLYDTAYAAPGNFEMEAQVLVAWDNDGEELVSVGRQNTLGELPEEQRGPLFIDYANNIILFQGRKFFRRNMTSGDAVLLLGITNAHLSSPMRDSIYIENNYVTSIFGNTKIYVEKLGDQWDSAGFRYIVPSGDKYFVVHYSNLFAAHSFVINIFYPLDSVFTKDPQPIDQNEAKDGLEFTKEDIAEINEQIEQAELEKEQNEALKHLDQEEHNEVEGFTFTSEDVKILSLENDEALLMACAAGDAACTLDVDPQYVRDFMEVSTKEQAYDAIQRMLEEQVAE